VQLKLHEVAHLMGISDRTLRHWLKTKSLPVERVGDQLLFNRAAVFEWALVNRVAIDPMIVDRLGGAKHWPRLSVALEAGRVLRLDVSEPKDVLPELAALLPSPSEFAREKMLDLLLSRPAAGFLEFGETIAIPHPRFPLILGDETPRLSVCFFEKPISLSEAGEGPCGVLFVLVAPTTYVHNALVAQLASAIRDAGVRRCINSRAGQGGVVAAARRLDDHVGRNGHVHSARRTSLWASLWGDGGTRSIDDRQRDALDLGTHLGQTG
jgi:excisionase family DNA binding protein